MSSAPRSEPAYGTDYSHAPRTKSAEKKERETNVDGKKKSKTARLYKESGGVSQIFCSLSQITEPERQCQQQREQL